MCICNLLISNRKDEKTIIFLLGCIVSYCSPTMFSLARACIGLRPTLGAPGSPRQEAAGALDAPPEVGVALAAI